MILELSIILLVLGFAFVVIEILIPGFGFFGIAGIISLIASVILTVLKLPYGFFIVIIELSMIISIMYLIFQYLKNHNKNGELILYDTLGFDDNSINNLDLFLNKEGVTTTALKPFGSAVIDGLNVDVYSRGPYIAKNTKIKVVDIYNNKIIVEEIEKYEN